MNARNEQKSRKRIIPIRPETPSRRAIFIIVAQFQNGLGEWLAPTITFEGPMAPILESGQYARDVGEALITAAFFFDEFMLRVKVSSEQTNERTDV